MQDLSLTVNLGHEIWDHLRQSDYLNQQVLDGVYAWYVRNQARPFDYRDWETDRKSVV